MLLLLFVYPSPCVPSRFEEQSVTGHHSHLILTGLKVSSVYRPFKGILSVFGPSQNDKHAGIGSRMKAARPLLANLYVSNNKPSPKLTLTIHFLHWNHSLQACRIFSPPTLYMHCICQKNSLAPTLFQRSFSLFWFLTCKYFASVPKILVFTFVCYGSMHFCPLIICVSCFCLQALCVCPVSGSGLACYSPAFCLLTAACDTLYRAVHAISLVHFCLSPSVDSSLFKASHTCWGHWTSLL